ncbi:transcriptional regulator, partial [Staphylococcus aureus]
KVFNEFNISEREASDIINNLRNFVSKNFDYSDKK